MKSIFTAFAVAGLGLVSNLQAEEADKKITVTCNDTMKFDTAEITAKVGETVSITVKNVGNLPKVAMGHNLVILKPGTEPMGFAGKCVATKDTTGLPADEADMKLVVASSKMLGPGEEETITFEAPAVGEYPFICTFPGHAALMKGVLKVGE